MASTACPGMARLTVMSPARRVAGAVPIHTTRAFTTTSAPPARQHPTPSTCQRPCIVARIPAQSLAPPLLSAARHASTSSSPAAEPVPDHILTWDRFFDLRRKRRYVNLGSSVVTAMGAIGIFGPVIAQQDLDGWATQISGLDPIIVLGITTFAVAAGGWLCGPSVGNLGFKTWASRKGWNRVIAEKEKSFYDRIKRYRADPSASSPQNPIPDYYGEKIASVKDYRRWLKDQRAFNLKKNKAFV